MDQYLHYSPKHYPDITSQALAGDHGPFLSFGRPAFGPQRRGTQHLPRLHGAAQRGSRGFGGQGCGQGMSILKGKLIGKHGDRCDRCDKDPQFLGQPSFGQTLMA